MRLALDVASHANRVDAGAIFANRLSRFTALSPEEMFALAEMPLRVSPFKAHIDAVCENHPTKVLIVLEGFACRYRLRRNGNRQHLAYLLPGDLIDLANKGDDQIGTLSHCKIAYVSAETFQNLLDRYPKIATAIRLAKEIEEATTREWLLNLGSRTAAERIAHLFCEMFDRLFSVGLTGDESYAFPVSQKELSATVGLSPVHLNRSLQSLRQAELIELRRGTLCIKDGNRLRAFAGFKPNYLRPSLPTQAA